MEDSNHVSISHRDENLLETIIHETIREGILNNKTTPLIHDIFSKKREFKLINGKYLLTEVKVKLPYRSGCKIFSCINILTHGEYIANIVEESLDQLQYAYFQLKDCKSQKYGHNLIRSPTDIVYLSKRQSYVLFPFYREAYGDLFMYSKQKKKLDEIEARELFHQICEFTHACHKLGIVLRDMALHKFAFVDKFQ